MVVQKTWNIIDTTTHQTTTPAEGPSSSWTFPAPVEKPPNSRPAIVNASQTKQTVSRQIAINTLAAMHRRFSLPGPVQPHSRPIAEFRASANKSLDMLRQTIQSAVTRDIDQVIKKYLEKFFVPAVNNIRLNLGEESVSEDQVRAVCRAMLDATRLLYSTPPKPAQSPLDTGDLESNSSADSKFGKQQTLQSPSFKRKEMDTESESSIKPKRSKQSDNDPHSVQAGLRDPDKWNPARLTQDTLFIMGSHAHKVLGMGNNRGRLYSKHAGLLRYPADAVDKEWIASHNLVNAVGGKTYIMVLEDIEELANSEAYRHSSLPMLGELTGFKVPPFMLRKIKSYIMKRSMPDNNPESPLPSTSSEGDKISVKGEVDNDSCDQILDGEYGNLPLIKDVSDFADIKVDEIKVEDLEDVDSIKVENIDDINVESIKEEDIKLENDDTLSVCKQTEDEQDQLVDGLLDADIDFLSSNLGNIESDADARKTIEKLTGANPDTITLVGDEFDLGTTLNTNNFSDAQTMKCITVASTTSGMVHSVPVAHIAASPRITGSTVHYYCSPGATASGGNAPTSQTIHHLPHGTVTIQTIPGTNSQMIRGIPLTTKTGKFSTVMAPGGASIIGFSNRTSTGAIIGSTAQYVTSKSFTTGNILHNAIVSRNLLNRNNLTAVTSGVTYNVTAVRPIIHTTTPKINTVTSNANDYDSMSNTRDMIDNACNSSVMLKKVLTLGSSGATKSFMMHNTQKILSTGFANGSAPPNVTIVSSGTSGSGHLINNGNVQGVSNAQSPPTSTLSATHATLSALLSSNVDSASSKK